MITAKITKGEDLGKKFRDSIPNIESGVQKEIMRLALKMTGSVMNKLSGDILKVRTGRLRRSIHPEWDFKPGHMGATVGTNVEYAAIHEYGFKGTVQVKSFQREMTKAFGRPIAPKQVTVSAHSRNINMPERSFLRSALKEMRPEIIEGLKNAVAKELKAIKR
jgi:phage gpG-like protein